MKHLSAALIALPLLFAAPFAHADTVTRTTTTTTTNECRDFTKTTTYVNKTVTTQGTACLFADGAWHDIGTPGNPIVEYDSPVVVRERPVVYEEPAVIPMPVPVYGGYYYDHPHHYGPGYYNRGYGSGIGWDIHGRF